MRSIRGMSWEVVRQAWAQHLIEMWIAKAWNRQLRISQLASMGQITFWTLLVYLVFRLGDLVVRGQLFTAWSGRTAALFATELIVGGLIPLVLLARQSERRRPSILPWARSLRRWGSSSTA